MSGRTVADAGVREQALDPTRSFIVQAPAGAGKTALLIQRYLRLLATVRRPEEILAITFTRKAAGEMKRRVLEALHGAGKDLPEDASDSEVRTRDLAQAALSRDAEFGWRLLENTVRLHIKTIDSFNASLTRQMPVLAHLGWQPGLVDDAQDLYHEAAVRTLALLDEDAGAAPALARLLDHLDGDQGKVAGLIAGMLARRDQWLRPDFHREPSRQELESALRAERERTMARARALFPPAQVTALLHLVAYATGELRRMGLAAPVLACEGLRELPAAGEAGSGAWLGLAGFLLNAQGEWRRAVTKAVGFPSKKDGGREGLKEAYEALVQALRDVPGLRQAIADLFIMPPAAFSDAQWEALSAVVTVLPVAAAQLLLVFAERGEVDHAQIAEGAVRSLGEAGEPTDLMLTLDERLSHILVDEFQDTSRSQWRLLAALTAEWSPDDGRTVFAVGDPMQSIYRFREADVGLYLKAWREGLPNVWLEGLRLATNFRSQQGIVDWVNDAFRTILPPHDDESEGAVSLAASEAFHAPLAGAAVTWHAFVDEDKDRARADEAARVVELVMASRAEEPEGQVAILVRNRTHLDRIVPALRSAGLRFRAVDIEPLAERQGVQDLVSLTRALAHAADRVAWLAVLRAPWCGLTLADLHALVQGDDRTVAELMADGRRLSLLSPDGAARLARAAAILLAADGQRLRGSLRERVEGAWLALGGPACLAGPADLEDAETFFDRLDEIAEADDLADAARLGEHLEDLYGAPDLAAPETLQVMTIHKAKGLEFATVIVPGLDRVPRAADTPLFRWKARTDGALLMAPIKEVARPDDAAYDYLKELDAREEAHEIERLLYVAATRAARRLHLLARVGFDEGARDGPALRAPSPRSLLGKAWPVARRFFEAAPRTVASPAAQAAAATGEAAIDDLRWIRPGALAVQVPMPAYEPPPDRLEMRAPIEFSWVGETARHVGTVAHRWLQRIAEEGLAGWNATRVRGLGERVGRELERRGVPEAERGDAVARVLAALEGTLADERGRWILGDHADAANEVRMCVLEDGRVRVVVMDRVFTADGGCWIVDYKTSRHEGADPEAFLDRERERYTEQMTRYARALGGEPRLGLYFPLIPGWRVIDG